MTGIELISAERARQVSSEGWTPRHDDEHDQEELAKAAACYAIPVDLRRRRSAVPVTGESNAKTPSMWPWDDKWWKPTPDDRIRELTKAGALIAAEIDRLLRKDDK